MLKKIGIGTALLSLILVFTACANSAPAPTPAANPAPASNPAQASNPEPTPAPNPDPEWVLNPKPRPSGPIGATWIQVQVDPDSQAVSLPVSELENNWNTHFRLKTTGGDINFMAYIFESEIHVRANVCPPCKSIGFALDENEGLLICDRCATLFDAGTGSGVEGACVDYPKASAPYEVNAGNLVIKGSDLIDAYQETLAPG